MRHSVTRNITNFTSVLLVVLVFFLGCSAEKETTEAKADPEASPTSTVAAAADHGKDQSPAPTFKAPYLEGGDFDLSEYLGKKAILLDWWSMNCLSCVKAIPALIDLQDRYADDLVVVGMNVDSFSLKRLKRFLATQSFKLTYPTVIDKNLTIMKQYESSILPTTVIIDKKGKVSYHHVGYNPGDEVAIEEHIKKVI